MDGSILIEVWALQMPIQHDIRGNTRDLMESEAKAKSNVSAVNNNLKVIDLGALKIMMDADVLRKRQEKLEEKLQSLRECIYISEQRKLTSLPLEYVKGIVEAPSTDVLKTMNAKYSQMKNHVTLNMNKNIQKVTRSAACIIS